MKNVDKKKLRNRLSKDTIEEAIEKLDKYGVCNILRPTGFGKSYMLAKITSRKTGRKYRYNKCLYIYPLTIIMEDVKFQYGEESNGEVKLHNTEFISYKKIGEMAARGELKDYIKDFDLIMCDECHTCGRETFQKVWEIIKDMFGPDKKHLIGVTASPDRMDSYPVIDTMFGGEKCGVFRFDVQDAYDTGLMHKPIYVLAIYDPEAYGKSVIDTYSQYCKDEKEKKELERRVAKIERAKDIIKNTLDENNKSQKYMKFIVFYVNKDDILAKKDMVKEWFAEAYPEKRINEYNIVSTNFEVEEVALDVNDEKNGRVKRDTLKVLKTLGHSDPKSETKEQSKEIDNTIDIINCIDMLNMGYHVDDITGIIMLRNTRSQIIYTQQLGRCQSVNADEAPIIFDFVNNCLTKMWFKNEAERREESTSDAPIAYGERGSNFEGNDVIVANSINAINEVIMKITRRKEYNKQIRLDNVMFWYKNVKTPLYVLSMITKKSPDELKDIIRLCGSRVESEDEVYRNMTKEDRENFEYLKTITDKKIVPDPTWIKIELSKRYKEEQ